jgi:hypothetical protein
MNDAGQGWTLIRSHDEWQEYCRDYELAKSWEAGHVSWPSVPASYPCMVTTYSPHLYRVVSAFLYITQATQLLAAAGMNVGRNPAFGSDQERRDHTGDIGVMAESANVVGSGPVPPQQRAGTRSQANFNRYVQANLLAMWRSLTPREGCIVPVPGVTAEQAQDLVIEALSDVDQWSRADLAQRTKMASNSILARINPPGEPPA